MSSYDEQRLAELLRTLPPAPEGWVKAAQELPLARAELDELVERCGDNNVSIEEATAVLGLLAMLEGRRVRTAARVL